MIGIIIAVGFLGFIIHIAARFDPLMSSMYIDTIGALIMWLVPMFLVIYRLKTGLCYDYFKPPVKNRPLFEFLYRVGDKRTVYGARLPGTEFSTVPKLGIIQEIGVPGEGVFRQGDKPVQQVLQDIAHTPNPKWFNYTYWLNQMGITNLKELAQIWDGYNPELMIKVWNRMQSMPQREPAELFMNRITNLSDEDRTVYNKALNRYKKQNILTKEGFKQDLKDDMKKMGKLVGRGG